MPTTYRFIPVYGASNFGPMCSILEIGDIRLLLDCGWDDRLDVALLLPVLKYMPTLTAVLISHPDFLHMGGLPFAFKDQENKVPIFLNADAINIAKFCLEDTYENRLEGEETCVYDKKDLNSIYELFQPLVYNQWEVISDKHGNSVFIRPRIAGHIVGGSIWDINTETDNLVYSMSINPLSDNHLNGAAYTVDGKVTMLITDVCEDTSETPRDYRQVDTAKFGHFSNLIADTLQEEHGNVLIPVDSAGRCLEVLLLLERVWEEKHLDSYKIYYLSKRNSQLIAHVRGITSNLNPKLLQTSAKAEREAFDLRYVTCVSVVENVFDSRCSKVVVASLPGLETSFSQILLNKWCAKPENLLLFVTEPAPGTLGDQILRHPVEHHFKYINRKKIPLMGEELEAKLAELTKLAKQQRREKRAKETIGNEPMMELSESESSDEMEDAPTNRIEHALFEYVDEEVHCDEFGVIPAEYKPVLTKTEEEEDDEEEDYFDDEETTQQYFKYLTCEDTLQLMMRREYVDLNGLSDYATLHGMIRSVHPVHVICWHGLPKQRDFFMEKLRSDNQYDVLLADECTPVEVVSEHTAMTMRLDERLLASLERQMIGDTEVGRVSACVEYVEEPDGDSEMLLTLNKREPQGRVGPISLRTQPLTVRHIYDLLIENEMDASLERDHIEVSDKSVVIRNERDMLVVEGNASEEFQRIQQLLSEQYIQV